MVIVRRLSRRREDFPVDVDVETDVDTVRAIGDVWANHQVTATPVYAMMPRSSFTPIRIAGPTGGSAALASRQSVIPRRPYGVLYNGRNVPGSLDGETDASIFAQAVSQGVDKSAAAEEDPSIRRMRLEAVLLLAKSPLSTRKLAQMAHLADGTEARTLVRHLNKVYDEHGRSIRIEQVAGGYRMLTRAAYAPWLARLGHLPSAVRLSSPMMETLAVVAYRGPVSRADVEAVRGVACGELLRQLMERDLIRISGRSEELGRPYLYDTTKHFLQLFGLASADALPPINWEPLEEEPEDDIEPFDPDQPS